MVAGSPPPNRSTPPDVAALLRDASAALGRGDAAAALRALDAAEQRAPALAEIHLNAALAHRINGNFAAGVVSLDRLLTQQPRHFVALLSKADLIERVSGVRQAARAYRNALQVAPPDAQLPPPLAAALRHARQVVAADTAQAAAFMRAQTAAGRGSLDRAAADRFDQSLDVFAGLAPATVQKPLLLHYGQMPAIPFYDRALFPFLPELEAATEMIAAELTALLTESAADFAPYIQFPPHVPVNQWGELNHNRRWSSYFLWQDGVRHDEACRRCPNTAALIDRLPLMHQPGFAPTAVFSALEPHTHIPPHTGSTNTRLLCHLPLILPGPARFRVGPQTRPWRLGEAWVFDDTIEHEAWNDADQMRVILILDLWSPFLSPEERALISTMMSARNAYYAGT